MNRVDLARRFSDPAFVKSQYRDPSNLNARIRLHDRFSINKQGWFRWVFDQFDLPAQCAILELGCGDGRLWATNADRIPEGWQVYLSDLTPGMVRGAHAALGETGRSFRFAVIDAQSIPFADATFDTVVANHMLYHVPNLDRAVSELKRVLKPGGRLYASTVGRNHLAELCELVRRLGGSVEHWAASGTAAFSLENGSTQLLPWFKAAEVRRYPDALAVTDAPALMDYVFSDSESPATERARWTVWIQDELERCGGVIHITKDSGMWVAS
jgi:ubiquinone/menaquinone biosynthesis C-methylase UbiE